ncbi:hypothetical protein G6F66_015075 [Rhizopus arrhizus]|nr:hypothetical protein G6F66_015075 [Rhizopus arrhizus]
MRRPRSTRLTGWPAPRTSSVALLDHGDSVPRRGTTMRLTAPSATAAAGGAASRMRHRVARAGTALPSGCTK